MKRQKGLEGLLGKALGALLAVGLAGEAKKAEADVYIRTIPEVSEWVADGVTEYRLDLVGDTTEHPDVKFSLWEGRLWIPHGVTPIRAELPDEINNPSQNVDDFFYNWQMADNPGEFGNQVNINLETTGNSTWPYRTMMNRRYVGPGCNGPEDSNDGLLGTWYFTVDSDAEIRDNVRFASTDDKLRGDCEDYKVSNCNSGGNCLRQNHQFFNIVAPQIAGDIDGDGVVDADDVGHFVGVLLGTQTDPDYLTRADLNEDALNNAADIQPFIEAYLQNAQ